MKKILTILLMVLILVGCGNIESVADDNLVKLEIWESNYIYGSNINGKLTLTFDFDGKDTSRELANVASTLLLFDEKTDDLSVSIKSGNQKGEFGLEIMELKKISDFSKGIFPKSYIKYLEEGTTIFNFVDKSIVEKDVGQIKLYLVDILGIDLDIKKDDLENTKIEIETEEQTFITEEITSDMDTIPSDENIYLSKMPDSEENIMKNIEIKDAKTESGDIVLFITNYNNFSIPDIEVQVIFYKNNEIVDTIDDGHDVLMPQNTVVSKLDALDDYDNYEIETEIKWDNNYKNWVDYLDINYNYGNEDNIIIN